MGKSTINGHFPVRYVAVYQRVFSFTLSLIWRASVSGITARSPNHCRSWHTLVESYMQGIWIILNVIWTIVIEKNQHILNIYWTQSLSLNVRSHPNKTLVEGKWISSKSGHDWTMISHYIPTISPHCHWILPGYEIKSFNIKLHINQGTSHGLICNNYIIV